MTIIANGDSGLNVRAILNEQRIPFLTEAEALTRDDLADGALVYLSDKYGGSYWRAKDDAEVIDGQASTAYTFADEMTIYRTSSSKPLMFDIDLNMQLLRALEAKQYRDWFTKQRQRDTAQNIAIYGDSLTFGQAGVSASGATNRIGTATGFGDSSTHNNWQFDQNVCVELEAALDEIRATGVTVSNRGFSGDTAWRMYTRHRTPPTAGVSIIWPSGINDGAGATSNGVTLSGLSSDGVRSTAAYAEAVRKFTAREILRGNAVVLMSGPNFVGGASGFDGTTHSSMRAVRAYETALQSVANEFGAHFVNTRRELLDQYYIYDITDDGTHLNPVGCKVVARRLTSLFVGEGWRGVRKVWPGAVLIASDATQDLLSQALSPIVINVSSGTPGLISANPSTINIVNGDPLVMSFFSEVDDLVVYINGEADGATVTVDLDGQALQQDYKSALSAGKTPQNAGAPAVSTLSVAYTGSHFIHKKSKPFATSSDALALHIVGRGYHTVTVSIGAAGTFNLESLEFQPWELERRPREDLVVRTTDSAAIQSNTTFAADSVLVYPVLTSKRYLVEGYIRFNSGVTPGFKWYLLGPTGWTAVGLKSGTHPADETNFGVTVTETGSANNRGFYFRATVTTSTTAGNLSFMWAQQTSTASDTKVLAGSFLRITEL